MDEFIIAVKRDKRQQAPGDLVDLLRTIDGVEVDPDQNSRRLHLHASPEGILKVRQQLGEVCHIEPVIRHRPLRAGDR